MPGRVTYLLSEVRRWKDEGRVTPEFAHWAEGEYGAKLRDEESGNLQKILFAIGGIVLLIGIITLYTAFWDELTDAQKLVTLLVSALPVIGAGAFLEAARRWRTLAGLLMVVGLGIYFFGISYANDRAATFGVAETATLIGAGAATLALYAYGLARHPVLSFFAPAALILTVLFWGVFTDSDDGPLGTIVFWTNAVVFAGLAAFLALPRAPGNRTALESCSWATALVMGPFLEVWLYADLEVDGSWPGIIGLAILAAVILTSGIFLRTYGLVIVGGLFLVADAIWLGSAEGGLVGTIIALLATAIGLIALAQSGLLKKVRVATRRPPPVAAQVPAAALRPPPPGLR